MIFIDRCLLETVITDSYKHISLWLLLQVTMMKKGNLPFLAWKREALPHVCAQAPTTSSFKSFLKPCLMIGGFQT